MLVLAILLVLLQQGCASNKRNVASSTLKIEPRSSWNATQPRPFRSHTAMRITVHHEGTKLGLNDDAAKKISNIQKWGMGPEKKWADVPYHFFIAPGGTIYEGRNPSTVGETSTEYDPTGHLLICCLGNLDVDTVPAAQLQSLVQLIHYASKQFNIPLDSLRTHKDFSALTICPGKNLSGYFENGWIKKELLKLK